MYISRTDLQVISIKSKYIYVYIYMYLSRIDLEVISIKSKDLYIYTRISYICIYHV